MGSRKAIVVAALAIAASVAAPAPPAAAAGHIDFVCSGSFSPWPTVLGGPSDCSGSATGVNAVGPTVCLPSCQFHLWIDAYAAPCPSPTHPPVVQLVGSAELAGTTVATLQAVGVGGPVVYPLATAPGSSGSGAMTLVLHPPIGTCAAPSSQAYDMEGSLTW